MADVIPFEEGRSAFGVNPGAYTDARPDYPPRVYEMLHDCGAASQNARTFEIGAGTGQATGPLLALGCTITVIEPDGRLTTMLGERLKSYGSSLTIMQSPFEDSWLPPTSFDLGVAAMAFHWLQQDSALAKVFGLLRPGGWWAMWWTVFGDPTDMDPFQRRTQALFQPLSRSPSHVAGLDRPFALDKDVRMAELQEAGFKHVMYEEIRWTPTLTTQQVQGLTATFSPVARLTEPERVRLLNEIGHIADEEFGGSVRRSFVTPIYLAQKPDVLS
ncbi:class I SAM-dependent methyltransferase [Pseudomonas aeruginosa]|uniref:class I SAM-dependent methyltransferase n=1 Tax=Pseudomonas aeruginosa TaxID=287 RepID=UPI001909ED66|nr:class I SAM-dependent methyltransferase [Pseudomonas aeruginosa]